MSFLRPIQWYHYYADPIWPDGTFKIMSAYWHKTEKSGGKMVFLKRPIGRTRDNLQPKSSTGNTSCYLEVSLPWSENKSTLEDS